MGPEEFKTELQNLGLTPTIEFQSDGVPHAFKPYRQLRDSTALYCLWPDGLAVCAVFERKFGHPLDSGQWHYFDQHKPGAQQRIESVLQWAVQDWQQRGLIAARQRLEQKTSAGLNRLYMIQSIMPATSEMGNGADHPVLIRHAIGSNGLEVWDRYGLLIIRAFAVNRHSDAPFPAVYIDAGGVERHLHPAPLRMPIYAPLPLKRPLPASAPEVFVAVGFVEAATVYECTGALTIYAHEPSHLEAIGRMLRGRYPQAKITFVANVRGEPAEAVQAAELVNGNVVAPHLEDGVPAGENFNELSLIVPSEEVGRQLRLTAQGNGAAAA